MNISARNQLTGVVSAIIEGAVNDEITLSLPGGDKLAVVITRTSRASMKLNVGSQAIALIKAPWVILASVDCGLIFSARNQFSGEVVSIERGAVNSTVHIRTSHGLSLVSVITNDAADDMALAAGNKLLALVKASAVVLATAASSTAASANSH